MLLGGPSEGAGMDRPKERVECCMGQAPLDAWPGARKQIPCKDMLALPGSQVRPAWAPSLHVQEVCVA